MPAGGCVPSETEKGRLMSNRALAFIVCLPIAGVIGFAAGRATSDVGTVMEMPAPGGKAHVRVARRFSMGAADLRVLVGSRDAEVEVRRLGEDTGDASEILWAPDGSLAAVLLNGSKLMVIDAAASRVLYELPLLEKMDGSRIARGVAFSNNALAVTFDDCPRAGAGCRPRFMALPKK